VRSARPRPPGFTLLETVISLGLFGLCLALALPFLEVQKTLWENQQAFREEYTTLAAAASWITRDLQEAGYRSPGPAVKELREELLSYALSRDEDEADRFGLHNRRLITVYHSGKKLLYRIRTWDPDFSAWERGSSHTLARGVDKVRFRGFDGAGRRTVDPSEIVTVEMTFTGVRSGSLSTLVTLRNRMH
jgi:type II secretory pathway component PulJ